MTSTTPSRGDWIRQMSAILQLLSVNENRHVLAESSLVVKHVTASTRVGVEVCVENLPDTCALDLPRRALHMTLDVVRETECRHGSS